MLLTGLDSGVDAYPDSLSSPSDDGVGMRGVCYGLHGSTGSMVQDDSAAERSEPSSMTSGSYPQYPDSTGSSGSLSSLTEAILEEVEEEESPMKRQLSLLLRSRAVAVTAVSSPQKPMTENVSSSSEEDEPEASTSSAHTGTDDLLTAVPSDPESEENDKQTRLNTLLNQTLSKPQREEVGYSRPWTAYTPSNSLDEPDEGPMLEPTTVGRQDSDEALMALLRWSSSPTSPNRTFAGRLGWCLRKFQIVIKLIL